MQRESTVFADEAERRAFLKGLEMMLRDGQPEQASALARQKAHGLVDREGKPLAVAALDQSSLNIVGFPEISALPRVTALSFDFSWPGHFAQSLSSFTDDSGMLAPVIETNLYSNGPYPFSSASRADFREACEYSRCPWRGEFEDIRTDCHVTGMDRAYGQVQELAVLKDRTPQEEDTYQLGAAMAAIAVHLAFKRHLVASGLPRPLAILVGSNEDFPHFVAPVVTADEARELVGAGPAPSYGATAGSRAKPERPRPQQKATATGPAAAPRKSAPANRDLARQLGSLGASVLLSALNRRK